MHVPGSRFINKTKIEKTHKELIPIGAKPYNQNPC